MAGLALGVRWTTAYNAIIRICSSGLPTLPFLRQVAGWIRTAVPYQAGGLLCTDPATLLFTNAFVDEVPPSDYLRLFDNELFRQDYAKFHGMARSGRRAISLLTETGGQLKRSARHREIYSPNGFQGEVRVIFRSGRAVLGVGCFTRAEGAPNFSDSEVAFLEGVADVVGQGLRGALLLEQVGSDKSDSPGMIVLDPDDIVQSITPAAHVLLQEMAVDSGTRLELPSVIYHVAHAARERNAETAVGPNPARVRLPSGRWLLVHASRLIAQDGLDDCIAVILEPAKRSQLASLLFTLYGLTQRERKVTELLVRGLALEDIARALSISLYTVRDHVKAIFAKVGVGSRPELTAKLVHEDFGAPFQA
jgi:DNA-binding CsgD family transcriptional regulator